MIDIYDAIKEKEKQVAALQVQISTLHAELKALRIAARILEGGSLSGSEEAAAASMPATINSGVAEKTRVWP